MTFWNGFWGPLSGFGWIFLLLGFVVMLMMAFVCLRRMAGHGRQPTGEIEDLRTGIRELREEIRTLRARS
jgi:hypothetical protein